MHAHARVGLGVPPDNHSFVLMPTGRRCWEVLRRDLYMMGNVPHTSLGANHQIDKNMSSVHARARSRMRTAGKPASQHVGIGDPW